MRHIERSSYLRRLESVRGVPDIRVLRGVRGSGKTELLSDLAHQISLSDPNANIIRAELRDSPELRDYGALHSFAEESFLEGKENCLLIDDADLCPSVELALASLHAMGKFDIYITCSGDFLSLSPLGTLLTGRTFDIPVFPFSFAEFMEYQGFQNRYEAFREYMVRGGMPGSCRFGSSEERQRCVRDEVLERIFSIIGAESRVRNRSLPERLARHLLLNAGRAMTVKGIAAELGAAKGRKPVMGTGPALKLLCNAYAFHRLRPLDIRSVYRLFPESSYYPADPSFFHALPGATEPDPRQVLKTIAAIELRRRGYEVCTGVPGGNDIDLIGINHGERLCIKVSGIIADGEALKREAAPLLEIRDGSERLILAETGKREYQHEGIRVLDIADWLLSPETGS